MTTLVGKALNALNSIKDAVVNTYMGTKNDPPPANGLHGDQESQQDTIHNGQDIKCQVAESDNAHVSEDSKFSSSRDTSKTKLTLHKDPVGVRREIRKPDVQPRHGQFTKTRSQSHSTADENASLKTQLEANLHNLDEATKHSGELERKVQKLTSEKDSLLASTKIEREDAFRGKKEAEKQIRDLQGKNQKLEDELKIVKGTLRGVQEKHLHTVKLLEERTADLKGAQSFLTTVDRYAGAEIMKMVEALNAEIFQGAALISELLSGDGTGVLKVDKPRKDAKNNWGDGNYLTQVVGSELIEHLLTKSELVQVDPLPLQLAIQAILTSWCVFMVDNFYAGSGNGDLKEIYRRIWESEPQAVAGRWRAMTTGQAKHLDSTTEKDFVINVLSTLLYLCGSPLASVQSQQTGLCLQQVASRIMDMWMKLRDAIHEGVTTTEMQVFNANANDIYQGDVMNDIYAETESVQQPESGKNPGHILCTVGMGLKRSVIRRNGDGTMSVQRDITLKAKIAFPSVLFDSA